HHWLLQLSRLVILQRVHLYARCRPKSTLSAKFPSVYHLLVSWMLMGSPETGAVKPGLRERKKKQTRETIAEVALALFAERGYEHTTLADIADAADVSRRTIFAYYDSKEDILLCEEATFFDELKRRLDERPDGVTTVDAIRAFLSSFEPPG